VADRIAIVTTSYPCEPSDPSGHFVAAEATALARAGNQVVVITARGGAAGSTPGTEGLEVVRLPAGDALGWPGILAKLRERPARALSLLGWVLRARRTLIERGPFDRTIAHFLLPSGFPLAASLRTPPRLEVVVHGSDARLCARLPRLARRAIRATLLRQNTHFRCSSYDVARTLEAALELAPGRAEVASPLLDLEAVPDRARARMLLALEPTLPVAVIVGRLVPSKRVDDALAATRLIAGLQTVVVGDGPELERLRHDFPDARFVGRVPRPQALTWIAAADVLVSASRDEGAPSAVREARALGVPVAARPAGDLERWAQTDPGLFVAR
jgi:teichuronic acid biosynthesis glycosyltransferase TuaC